MVSQSMSNTVYERLESELGKRGADAALDLLFDELRQQKRYHELFDARLMQARHRLGLPVILTERLDDLEEPLRTRLEDAYMAACREVGDLLLAESRVAEAWRYYRVVGDKSPVAAALERIEPNEENLDKLLEIALNEGVSPELGFRLVLENYGLCNAITMFEQQLAQQPTEQLECVVTLLVDYLHKDLTANVRAEIVGRESVPSETVSLGELVRERPWLFENDNYHVDTSHLSAVVRFARLSTKQEVLHKALDLTEYGRRLSETYQFAGEEPFVDTYPSHALFFAAQLGSTIEEAIDYFKEKARTLPLEECGSGPAEVLVLLLTRLGRYREAIDTWAELIPAGTPTTGFAPSLVEMASASGEFRKLIEVCRERDDLLGFTAGLVEDHLATCANKS